MSEENNQTESGSQPDVRHVVRHVIEEFMRAEQSKAEPAYKAELIEERRARYEPRWRAALSEFNDDELRTAAAVLDRMRDMFEELRTDA